MRAHLGYDRQYTESEMQTRITYWILGDDYWVESSPREIQEFMRQGFIPVIRISRY